MASGATLDDVLRTFRTDDQFGFIDSIRALLAIARIGLSCAKTIVSDGRSYAHLTLADLDLIADTPDAPFDGAGYDILGSRWRAIVERKPYLLYVRDRDSAIRVNFYTSATPLEAPPQRDAGSIYGSGARLELVRDAVRSTAAAWPTEFRILRDDPDQVLLHFLRARQES